MQHLQNIPLWVLPILLALMALGLLQTRPRLMAPQRLITVGIALTLGTLMGVVQQWRPSPLGCWKAC